MDSLAGLSYAKAPLKPAKEGEDAEMSIHRSQLDDLKNITLEMEAKTRENF